MQPITEERLLAHHALSKAAKVLYVAGNKGPADPPLELVVVFDDDQVWMGRASQTTYEALEAGALDVGSLIFHSALKVSAQRGLNHNITQVIVTSDAHVREGESLGKYKHGDFRHDFETNPASDVREGVITWVAERSGEDVVVSTAYSKYHYDDRGQVSWGDTMTIMHQVVSEDDESNVGPAMAHLFETLGVVVDHAE